MEILRTWDSCQYEVGLMLMVNLLNTRNIRRAKTISSLLLHSKNPSQDPRTTFWTLKLSLWSTDYLTWSKGLFILRVVRHTLKKNGLCDIDVPHIKFKMRNKHYKNYHINFSFWHLLTWLLVGKISLMSHITFQSLNCS